MWAADTAEQADDNRRCTASDQAARKPLVKFARPKADWKPAHLQPDKTVEVPLAHPKADKEAREPPAKPLHQKADRAYKRWSLPSAELHQRLPLQELLPPLPQHGPQLPRRLPFHFQLPVEHQQAHPLPEQLQRVRSPQELPPVQAHPLPEQLPLPEPEHRNSGRTEHHRASLVRISRIA